MFILVPVYVPSLSLPLQLFQVHLTFSEMWLSIIFPRDAEVVEFPRDRVLAPDHLEQRRLFPAQVFSL